MQGLRTIKEPARPNRRELARSSEQSSLVGAIAISQLEELPAEGCQLVVGRMVDDVESGDARRRLRPMLLDIVAEVRECSSRTGHQRGIDSIETAAHVGEEFMR